MLSGILAASTRVVTSLDLAVELKLTTPVLTQFRRRRLSGGPGAVMDSSSGSVYSDPEPRENWNRPLISPFRRYFETCRRTNGLAGICPSPYGE